MLRTRLLSVLCLLPVWQSAAASAAPVELVIDKAHTHVGFVVRHIFSRLPGTFREFDGPFTWDEQNPAASKGTFIAKAASINTGVDKRDEHLRSQDFFWAEKYQGLYDKAKYDPANLEASYLGEADRDFTVWFDSTGRFSDSWKVNYFTPKTELGRLVRR